MSKKKLREPLAEAYDEANAQYRDAQIALIRARKTRNVSLLAAEEAYVQYRLTSVKCDRARKALTDNGFMPNRRRRK